MASAFASGLVGTTAGWLHSATSDYRNVWVGIYNRQSTYSECFVFAEPSGGTGNTTALVAGGDIPPKSWHSQPFAILPSGYNLWGSAESASGHIIRAWEDE